MNPIQPSVLSVKIHRHFSKRSLHAGFLGYRTRTSRRSATPAKFQWLQSFVRKREILDGGDGPEGAGSDAADAGGRDEGHGTDRHGRASPANIRRVANVQSAGLKISDSESADFFSSEPGRPRDSCYNFEQALIH
jgi:hypothetical protein